MTTTLETPPAAETAACVDAIMMEQEAEDSSQFPFNALPPRARQMVDEISRSSRTPGALAAMCVLACGSASVGKGLRVAGSAYGTTPANLYLAVSCPSGTGKTVVFSQIASPIYEFEQLRDALLAQRNPTELQSLEIKLRERIAYCETESEVSDAKRAEHASELRKARRSLQCLRHTYGARRFICEDITVKSLMLLLLMNGECLSSFSSDARDPVQRLTSSAKNQGMSQEGIYLKGWSEEQCRIDRVMDDPIILHAPNISLFWMFQPDKMRQLLGRQSLVASSGFGQRCLFANINATPRHIDRHIQQADQAVVEGWEELIFELLANYRTSENTRIVQSSPEAIEILDAHHNAVVDSRLGADSVSDTYLARHSEKAWRLALVLHALTHGKNAQQHSVSAETAQNAIAVLNWFEAKTKPLIEHAIRTEREQCLNRIIAFSRTKPEGFTARDIQHRNITSSAAYTLELLVSLEQAGRLRHEDLVPAKGGRAKRIYTRTQ